MSVWSGWAQDQKPFVMVLDGDYSKFHHHSGSFDGSNMLQNWQQDKKFGFCRALRPQLPITSMASANTTDANNSITMIELVNLLLFLR